MKDERIPLTLFLLLKNLFKSFNPVLKNIFNIYYILHISLGCTLSEIQVVTLRKK